MITIECIAAHVSQERIRKLTVLEALVSLMIINKLASDSFELSILQFAYNNCNF